ncbi:MAG: acyl-CoA thioesterase [Hyphomicrobiales bacterium]|nr:acyl-CoA thioesterase [Hyphomicrobiales bacterium]MCP4997547.1 acyl-CoA thioesterase [Hyphomicrobiales bacterium]
MRFADCDPAGIAFYPRLMEHVNGVVEDWFEWPLDYPFNDLHFAKNKGLPTVAINVNFVRPAELGDVIDWRLTVKSLNRSSMTLAVLARRSDGEELMHAEPTLVHTDFERDPPKSEPFPDDSRKKIAIYQDPQ